MERSEAERELEHIVAIVGRCTHYLDEDDSEVEFSHTGRTVQQVLGLMALRIRALKDKLPVKVRKVTETTHVSLLEERYYKLGIMLIAYKYGIVKEEELSAEGDCSYD